MGMEGGKGVWSLETEGDRILLPSYSKYSCQCQPSGDIQINGFVKIVENNVKILRTCQLATYN